MSAVPEQVSLDLEDIQVPADESASTLFKREFKLSQGLSLALILISFVTLISFIYYLSLQNTLPIKQVSVGGDFRNLSPLKLQELIRDRVNAGFFNLDVQDVRDAVIDEAWVDDVIVQRVWPDKVHVIISERVPIVRWGNDSLLDNEATLFSPEKSSIPSNLPLLSGPLNSESVVLKNYLELSSQLAPLSLTIEEMILDERRSWSFLLSNGTQIIIGREDYSERLNRFMFWLPNYLLAKLQQIQVIDLRYTNGFAVRWISDHE